MSAMLELLSGMVKVIADNPASILIVLGFFALLGGLLIPFGIGVQLALGGLGFFMMIIGVIVHVTWLQN
jgi:hypothetical protein